MSHEEIYNIYVYKKMYTGQNYIYVVIDWLTQNKRSNKMQFIFKSHPKLLYVESNPGDAF